MANSKTMQAIVEIAGSVSPTLGKAVQDTTNKLGGINVKALAVGAAVAGSTAAIVKGAIEAGKYLADLGGQFDEVTDSIRIGTGATGDALDGLVADFDAVYGTVPTTMEDASKAIADYNTRLGLSGDALQGLSKQAIQVADMLDEDLGTVIETSSKAFQQWNIDADNMGGAMDYVFKVSQSTGTGFSELCTDVQLYGAQLQEMGYSFEEATALIGQMNKAGVNSEEVLAAMKKSVAALAKEGLSASDGMEMYAEAIKNAGSMTEATTIAAEIFGTRAASTMAAAIRDGSISVAELTAELQANGETITGCAEDTYDFAERLQIFKQKAQVALKPLANTMFDALNDLMPVVGSLMDGLIPIIEDLTATLVPLIQDVVAQICPMLQELVPPLLKIAGTLLQKLIPPVVEIITSVLPVLIQLVEMLMPIVDVIISDILPIAIDLLNTLLPVIMDIISRILPVVISLLNKILPILSSLLSSILPVIIDLVNTLIPVAMEIIDAVLPVVIQLLDTLMPILTQIIKSVLPVVTKLIQSLLPIVTKVIDAILPVLISLLDTLTPILDLVIALLGPILDLFMTLLSPILDLISAALDPLIEILTELIGQALKPLQPLIEILAGLLKNTLGAALKAITPIVDAVKNVFGGLIDFVKAIFTGDWSAAWDAVKRIFTGIWDGLKAAVKAPIEFIRGAVSGLTGTIGNLFTNAWNTVKNVWSGVGNFFSGIWNGIKTAFSAVTDWFRNIFSNAWQAVKNVFSAGGKVFDGIKDGIVSTFKTVVNAIIKGINKVVSVPFDGINWALGKIKGVEIMGWKPFDWIKTISTPQIPLLAEGGFTEGVSIAGEAGTEAVISFDPSVREENIETWTRAGKLLGVLKDLDIGKSTEATDAGGLAAKQYSEAKENENSVTAQAGRLAGLDDFSLGQLEQTTIIYYDFSGFSWSPEIHADEGTDKETFMEMLRNYENEFLDWFEAWLRRREVGNYARNSIY